MFTSAGARPTSRAFVGVLAALLLAVTVSACAGSGKPGASAALLTSTASDRAAQLQKQAQSEQALNWSTSLAGPVVNDIIVAFEKKYPAVKVSVTRADEGVIIPQTVQAIAAGKPTADVIEGTASGALALKDAGVLQPYQESNASDLDPKWKVTSGNNLLLVTDRVSYISFGYNQDALPVGTAPTTINDLLNPALRGKLAMETDSTSAEWVGAVLHSMGQPAGEEFLRRLGQQQVAQTALSGSALMGLVASGQYGGSPAVFHNHERQNETKGARVGWVPLAPVVANVGQLGILKDAAHPAAAMLFVDFLTGPDGQHVLEKQLYSPPEQRQPFDSWIPSAGAASADAFNKELQTWSALQKKYFG